MILFLLFFTTTQLVAKECNDEMPLRDDIFYATPRFHELGNVLLFPLSWDLKFKRKENFDQMIISKNGTSLIAFYFKDDTVASLKEWAKGIKGSIKSDGKKVYSMKKKSVCIGKSLIKNYTMILDGPNNEKDRIEMYLVNVEGAEFFINLWAGVNQVEEWAVLHEMLVQRDNAEKLDIKQ